MELPVPSLRWFCDLEVELGPIREMGEGRAGRRRIIPIIGGTAKGDGFQGRVMNLGADWQTLLSANLADLDTRYAIETDDGAVIEIINKGYRHGSPEIVARLAAGEDVDPSEYYMRTSARLESGDPRYQWLNNMIFVGVGAWQASRVLMTLYVVE